MWISSAAIACAKGEDVRCLVVDVSQDLKENARCTWNVGRFSTMNHELLKGDLEFVLLWNREGGKARNRTSTTNAR